MLVRQPANLAGVNMTVVLAPNSATVVDLTPFQALITSTLANAADNKSLYISATALVSGNYIIASGSGQESISLKGSNAVGDDFYAPFPNNLFSLSTGSLMNTGFDVVATETGTTTLLITPRAGMIGRTKDITFVTTLTQGETFSGREILRNRTAVSVVSRDLDGDLDADMAVLDGLNNALIIFTNNGAGLFTETAIYPTGLSPAKVISALVNADLFPDLVVVNSGGNSLSIFLGNGNGSFRLGSTVSLATLKPVSVDASDINGDTFIDLVVANNLSNSISYFINTGAGNFVFASSVPTGTLPTDVGVGDFDSDGNKDLVVTNGGNNNLSLIYGTGPGTFSATAVNYATGTNPSGLTIADLNGDNRPDVVTANRNSNNISVLYGTLAGTLLPAANFNAGTNPVSVVAHSLDAGPDPDLVVANFGSGNISALISIPGGFAAPVNYAVGTNPNQVAFADINSDGFFDFITANTGAAGAGSYTRWMGTGNGTLTAALTGTYNMPSLLPGSIVSADKKIAFTMSGAITTASSCPAFYADQITNLTSLGKEYVIHSGSPGDIAYILAPLNSTSLTITSSAVTNWLINSGETYAVNTSTNALTHVLTDKPVYIFNLTRNSCRLGGAQLAPAYCAGSYTTGFVRMSSDSLFLQIVTRSGFQTTFTLEVNGIPQLLPAAGFTAVPGSGGSLVGARIYFNVAAIPAGAYCILKNSADLFGLSVENGSSSSGNQFSHLSNFKVNTYVIANPVSTATICSNTQFTLNGVVGGGPITGVWNTNGFGTLSGGNTQLTNNVYIPNPIDTNISPVNIILTSTGICPNRTDTLKLTVKQGPLVTAGAGSVICSNNGTVQLNGNVYGATNQGVWSVVAPGNGTFSPGVNTFTPMYTLSNTDTSMTLMKFVITSTNNAGCNAESDTVSVIVNKAPIVTASLVNPIVRCANNSTVFLSGAVSGTTTSTGKWESTGSGIFVPNSLSLINNYIPSQSDIAAGSIYIRLESTNNLFCNPVRDSVQVVFTFPSIPNAGIDLNSCRNNARAVLNGVITGTNTSTGIWLGGGGIFLPSNSALTNTYYATPAEVSAGFVVLTFSTTNSGLCAGSSDQVKVTFQDKPTANFTVTSVCQNLPTYFTDQSLNTSGIGALNGWEWDLGDGTVLSNTVDPIHTYSSAGTFTTQLIVKNTFDCFDTIRRPVVVFQVPTASLQITRACSGSAQLISFIDKSTISPPGSISGNGYYWDFGGEGFSISKDTSIIFPSEGIYGVTHIVTSGNNCKSVITQSVNITPKPRARFKIVNNASLGLGANIAFLDSSNIQPSSWSWDLGNGQTSSIKDPVTTYTANGTYTVALTIFDQFGCSDTFTSTVTIKTIANEITQLIPNLITPNSDGKNDIWRLDFIDVFFPGAEIEIYSRWGERIFRSIGYSNAWDGSYKGDPLPVGVYFYVIKLNNKENEIFKGSITLMK